jgi:serine/threonine protein kinase
VKICPDCNKEFDDGLKRCPKDNVLLETDNLLGSTLNNKYKIEKRIGRGGMGSVYLALDLASNEPRAIKVLLSSLCEHLTSRRRFLREAESAQKIKHPNIVHIYEVSETPEGQFYMVMEYIKGHTLSEELNRCKQFSPERVVELLLPVVEALDVAHKNGIVHRDLKPENMMLVERPNASPLVKLLDLGIAKVQGKDEVKITATGELLGTPFYMSPEQWGEPPGDAVDGKWDVDLRVDIYSIGVIFYQFVTGKLPFPGPHMSNLLIQHITVVPPALHEIMPSVPKEFGLAVAKAMAKDRCDRHKTAQALIEDLKKSLSSSQKRTQSTTTEKNFTKQQKDASDNAVTNSGQTEEVKTESKSKTISGILWSSLKNYLGKLRSQG